MTSPKPIFFKKNQIVQQYCSVPCGLAQPKISAGPAEMPILRSICRFHCHTANIPGNSAQHSKEMQSKFSSGYKAKQILLIWRMRRLLSFRPV
jgi:hypothetical protein